VRTAKRADAEPEGRRVGRVRQRLERNGGVRETGTSSRHASGPSGCPAGADVWAGTLARGQILRLVTPVAESVDPALKLESKMLRFR